MTSFESQLGEQTSAVRPADGSLHAALRLPSPVEQVHDDRLAAAGIELWCKRDDLIHPDVPGSKWRKLKYNLAHAATAGHDTLLTFGGAYSNHLRAVAVAGASGGLLNEDVAGLQRRTFGAVSGNWRIEQRFHFGGFARRTSELDAFIDDFAARHAITLDWVYVGKMMYGIFALAQEGTLRPGTRVVAVITG